MHIYNLQTSALEKPSFGVVLLGGRGEGRGGKERVLLLGTAQCPKKLVNGPVTKCSPTIPYFHNVLLI